MLRVGLTGGIGAGKSTVARRLAEHGAIVVDADRIAREVVAQGSEGLAEVVAAFGQDVLTAGGLLDRPMLAKRVFNDAAARATLNAIVHPRVAARTAELVSAASAETVLVHDIPLLVENGLGPNFHLVVVVDAPVEERVRRLAERGMAEDDARARIATQASHGQRRAAADVWLDNGGRPELVQAAVDELWVQRLVPFEANVRLRRGVRSRPALVDADPTWPAQAARLIARIAVAAGDRAIRIDHVGSTAVPGLPAKDVIDLQVSVRSLADADAVRDQLEAAGFPWMPGFTSDVPKPSVRARAGGGPAPHADQAGQADGADRADGADGAPWQKRVHCSADPGRPANVHLRVVGSPDWLYALLFRDWLRGDPAALAEYLELKRRAAAAHAGDENVDRYAAAKEPWFERALPRAQAWAERSGWAPPIS